MSTETHVTMENFKDDLAAALADCPPVRRRIIKKKMYKGKIGLKELYAFIAAWKEKSSRQETP